jgi:hypothetical protein
MIGVTRGRVAMTRGVLAVAACRGIRVQDAMDARDKRSRFLSASAEVSAVEHLGL